MFRVKGRGGIAHLSCGLSREKGMGGSVPLVLKIESQGQLEVQLDRPTLMGPTQGIPEVHINLEEKDGRHETQPSTTALSHHACPRVHGVMSPRVLYPSTQLYSPTLAVALCI